MFFITGQKVFQILAQKKWSEKAKKINSGQNSSQNEPRVINLSVNFSELSEAKCFKNAKKPKKPNAWEKMEIIRIFYYKMIQRLYIAQLFGTVSIWPKGMRKMLVSTQSHYPLR